MRTYVITGSASGIGAATSARLAAQGHRVIGVDLVGADIAVDLGTEDGRQSLVDEVSRRVDTVDAVIANAGVMGRGAETVRVNYFGAIATLEGLRPLLARGTRPRAAATASFAVVQPVDEGLVDACLLGDEAGAVAHLEREPPLDPVTEYASTKRALARWIRAHAATPAWAGAGIALNGVCPGTVRTAMTAPLLADPGLSEIMDAMVPMPYGGVADAAAVATALAFLTDAATQAITGQLLFVDGGADCVVRGDDVFSS